MKVVDERLYAQIKALPKIELHRHLEASMRLDTLVKVARDYAIDLPHSDREALRPLVQMMPHDPHDWSHFLGKFQFLRQFFISTEVIERITREIVEDAAEDNVRYLELRFTPKALTNITGISHEEIVRRVCETATLAAADNDIRVGLIVSINRHEGLDIGEESLEAALAARDIGVVGFDLAGNEAVYPGAMYYPLFKRAKAEGLGITIHAGEWAGAPSVWDAIGNLHADRVGHGIRSLEDPGVVKILVDREITLEICPSSNYYSGIVPSLEAHPLPRLVREGIPTTLNTDDPILCDITLTDEMYQAVHVMNLTLDDLKQHILRAARAAFLTSAEREAFLRELQLAFESEGL